MNQTSDDAERLYLDDLYIGQTFESGTYPIDTKKIKAFAAEFDPQPFHLDEEAAKASLLGGLSASGWHTAAITMRLIVSLRPLYASGIVGLGAEVNWPRPTRPGDELRVVAKVAEITPSRTRPDRGIVTMYIETLNQRDEVVQTLKPKLVMFRRGARGT